LGLGHDVLDLRVDALRLATNFISKVVPLETQGRELEHGTTSSEDGQELVDE